MIWLTVQITNCLKRSVLQIIPCTTCSHHIVQLICVYVVILSGCLNTVLICIRNHSLFELCINILNDIVLVLFCSCYVFIVCLISFASYIITSYMDDVRLSHLNKDYLLTLLTYLQGNPYHSSKLHQGPCSSVGIRRATDTQTDRHRQLWPLYISHRPRFTVKTKSQNNSCPPHRTTNTSQ